MNTQYWHSQRSLSHAWANIPNTSNSFSLCLYYLLPVLDLDTRKVLESVSRNCKVSHVMDKNTVSESAVHGAISVIITNAESILSSSRLSSLKPLFKC